MGPTYHITIVNCDAEGNFWKETLPLNAALLKLMRFARKNPDAECTIELRETSTVNAPAETTQRSGTAASAVQQEK